jgi:multiple sugar transport system permease protein
LALPLHPLRKASIRRVQIAIGFENWRPVLYAYVLWGYRPWRGQIMARGEAGHRALLPFAGLVVHRCYGDLSTFFSLYIAFTDWNLSAFDPPKLNGL